MINHFFSLILFCLVIFAIGCGNSNKNILIIKVGTTQITYVDVETKLNIEACYRDDKTKPESWLGLYQLIENSLTEEIARTVGIEITPAMMADEVKRVDKETKAPGILNAVKKVCPDDKAYQEIYLKPRVINRLLHYRFSEDKTIQHEPYRKATDMLTLAKSGKDLKLLDGYEVKDIDLSKPQQPNPELSRFNLNLAEAEKELAESILNNLQPGQVYRSLRDDRYVFTIIKLLEKKDRFYKYEVVTVKKVDFDKWFDDMLRSIRKEVYQKDKIEEILKNISTGPVHAFLIKP